jgi:tetratricopeptide (TPR) repeat protein
MYLRAQELSLDKQIERIDSLQSYNHVDEAYKEANLLYSKFSSIYSDEKYLKDKLNVMLLITEIQVLRNKWDEAGEWGYAVIDYTDRYNFPDIAYSAHLKLAIIYEQAENYEQCLNQINKAYELYKANNLKKLFSTYYIRKACFVVISTIRIPLFILQKKG